MKLEVGTRVECEDVGFARHRGRILRREWDSTYGFWEYLVEGSSRYWPDWRVRKLSVLELLAEAAAD